MSSSNGDREPVELLAEEFLERRRTGQKPTVQEYTERYPHLAAEIRDIFPTLLLMENVDPGTEELRASTADTVADCRTPMPDRVGDYRILREIGRGAMGVVYEAEQQSLGRRVALKILPRQLAANERALARFRREARAAARLHHTNIVPVFEVGQDADTAYYAMQYIQGHSLDQVLAELRGIRGNDAIHAPDHCHNPAARTAAISLDRGNFLAGCHDSGESAKNHLHAVSHLAFAGEVTGEEPTISHDTAPSQNLSRSRSRPLAAEPAPLTDLSATEQLPLDSSRRDRYYQSVAHIGVQVASALCHAHERNTIHRDIKPSNLLLDTAGVVWVADFGLAKFEDDGYTRSGDLVGTLRYMSPERFKNICDARGDIYALGVTLYELLVLRPAFESLNQLELMDRISKLDPPRPRAIDRRIPRDLETIVLKAMDKDPSRRYRSASEMSEDLQRFLRDEPIRARRLSLPERFGRWAKHNRKIAALTTAVFALMALLAAGAVVYGKMQMSARYHIEAARDAMARELYATDMFVATKSLLDENDPYRTAEILARHMPKADETDLRCFEWYYLWNLCQRGLATPRIDTPDGVNSVAFSHDDTLLAVQDKSGLVTVFDVATQRPTEYAFRSHWAPHSRTHLAFSPKRQLLACINHDSNGLTLHDLQSGVVRRLKGEVPVNATPVFSPDGAFVAAAGVEGKLLMWHVESGKLARTFDGHFHAAAFSPDGQLFAAAEERDVRPRISVWDARSGEAKLTLVPHEFRQGVPGWGPGIWSIAFSSDSKQLAAILSDTPVRLWNLETKLETVLAGHSDRVRSAVFLPDGQTLATGGIDGAVQLWDLKSLTIRKTLVGHQGGVTALAASSNGKLLASGSSANQVILWDISAELSAEVLPSDSDDATVIDLCVSPDDGPLVLLEQGSKGARFVTFWDLRTNTKTNAKLNLSGPPSQITMSSDGVLCVVCDDGQAHLWNVSDRTSRGVVPLGNILPGPKADWRSRESSIALSDYGTRLAAVERDGSVTVWDTGSPYQARLLRKISSPSGLTPVSFALSPNGKTVATSDGFSVRVWNVDTEQAYRSLLDGRQAERLAFSPDGSVLAATDRFAIRLWDMSESDSIQAEVIPAELTIITSLTFASDNRTLMSSTHIGTISFWDIPTRRCRFSLNAPAVGTWMRTRLAADQSALVAFGYGGLKVWKADRQVTAAEPVVVGRQRPAAYGGPIDAIVESLAWVQSGNWLRTARQFGKAEERYDRALELSPKDSITLRLRGNLSAQSGRWADALADHSRASELVPGGYTDLRNHAALLLCRGDRESFLQVSNRLFDEFGTSSQFDPTTCLIVPGAIEKLDACVLVARLRAEQAKNDPTDKVWKLCTKALAEYRVANFERTLDDLAAMREVLVALRKPSLYDECRGCLLAAMASWQLNRKEVAREWLSKGQEIFDAKLPKEGKDDITLWQDWIHCQTLLREANELIGGVKAK